MKHLADLQLTAAFAASRVYRCYGCDYVLQQAQDPLESAI